MINMNMHETKIAATAVIVSLIMGGCAGDPGKQEAGTVIGGVGGALIGSQFGSGKGHVVGAAIGGVAGALAGSQVGKAMDQNDQAAMRNRNYSQDYYENSPRYEDAQYNREAYTSSRRYDSNNNRYDRY